MSNYFPGCQLVNPGADGGAIVEASTVGDWGMRFYDVNADTIGLIEVGSFSEAGGVDIDQTAAVAVTYDLTTYESMDANGDTTGVAIATDLSGLIAKLYWCQGGDFTGALGFSNTSPTKVNGQYYLGNAGNAAKCRFLGWASIDGLGKLTNTLTNRLVVNYLNRRHTPMELVPNYVNNNTTTTYSRTLSNWGTLAATASASQMNFIANGEDAAWFSATFRILTGDVTSAVQCGIGLSTTQPLSTCSMPNAALTFLSCACSYCYLPAFGAVQTPQMLAQTGGVAISFVADVLRNGAASDPPCTFMHGWVMA